MCQPGRAKREVGQVVGFGSRILSDPFSSFRARLRSSAGDNGKGRLLEFIQSRLLFVGDRMLVILAENLGAPQSNVARVRWIKHKKKARANQ